MPYQSPLSLLGEYKPETISTAELKRIKAELLLQFQFSSASTILIKDEEYDKDGIVRLMDKLIQNAPIHVAIYNNKPLLEFLEREEIGFFRNIQAQNKIFNDPEMADAINGMVVEAIDEMLPEWILPVGNETTTLLRDIRIYTNKLPAALQIAAYSKTFSLMRDLMDNLRMNYAEPFSGPDKRSIQPELVSIITKEFLGYFKYLPGEFDLIREQFCTWCNNNIVVAFSQRQNPISQWPRGTLHIVMEAATIASTVYNKEGNLKIAASIDAFLSDEGVTSSSGKRKGSGGWITVLAFIIGMIKIFTTCHRMDERRAYQDNNLYQTWNSKNNYNPTGYAYSTPSANPGSSIEEEDGKIVDIYPSRYNGGANPRKNLIKFISTKETPERTIITYQAEFIPSRIKEFNKYVPSSVEKKYKGSKRDLTLIFVKKGIPEVQFRHNINVDFTNGSTYNGGTSSNESGVPVVRVQPRSEVEFVFKGFATRMDTTGKILSRDTIAVTGRESSSLPFMKMNGKPIHFDESYSDESQSMHARIKGLLQNLDVLNHSKLYAGTGQGIQGLKLYTFRIEDQDTIKAKMPKITGDLTKSTMLYFLFKSSNDGIAYFTLTQNRTDIKFMFDTNTGLIRGIQMATVADKQPIIERLELFSIE